MNSTLSTIDALPFDPVTLSGWAMFLVSEIMPFIRKNKENNGFLHTALCILKGSKCMIDSAINAVEKCPANSDNQEDHKTTDEGQESLPDV